jgi:hypothetical protein
MDDFGPIAQAVAQSGAQILPVCGEFSSDKGFAANPHSSDGGGVGRMGCLKMIDQARMDLVRRGVG